MDDPAREPNPPRPAGLLLAGGRSRRFGVEKAMALFAGRTLLDWSLQSLVEVCEIVAVSAPAGSAAFAAAAGAGHEVLPDNPDHPAGPLAGIAAGLAWARERGFRHLATLPCDTPLLGATELVALGAPTGDRSAVFATTVHGPEPLCAVWSTDLAALLADRLTAGRHPSVKALLSEIGATPVFFADPTPFEDADTPQALAALDARRAAFRSA